MRILFYISTIRGGGAGRVLSNLANYMVSRNHEVYFVTNFPANTDYPLDERIHRFNIEKSENEHKRILRNPIRISRLRKEMKVVNPDVCLSFMGENNVRLLMANTFLKKKCIVSVRNDPNREYKSIPLRMLAKLLYRRADGMVFQTQDAKEWFSNSIQSKSTIILNAVAQDFFDVQIEDSRRDIIAMGRLTSQKNYHVLIDAFSLIANSVQDNVLIYGEGSLHEHLQIKIKQLGLEKRVKLMGTTTQVPEVLRYAKAFVMPSDYEGMPNALMEAMAVGLPVISTDCPCGGPRALIQNGINGLLVPVRNEEKLAKAMERVLSDNVFAKKLGDNARKIAESYRPEIIFKQWENYLEKVVEE